MSGESRSMQIPSPIPLNRLPKPFDDPNWIYEIKHDGFRALAVIEDGRCRFYSRKKHRLTGFRDLAEAIVRELNVENAILEGELAAIDEHGKTVFAALMQRSKHIQYLAFDLPLAQRQGSSPVASCRTQRQAKAGSSDSFSAYAVCRSRTGD